MAQMHDEAYRADMPGSALPPHSASVLNWIGAALSLALLIGVCAWGYRLMVRDVSGVPVIQALAGPMRVSPDDPGGRRAAHQGLAVNAIAAEGQAAEASDAVALAPPPVTLEPGDRQPQRAGAAQHTEDDPLDGASVRATAAAPSTAADTESPRDSDRAEASPGPLPEVIPLRSPVPPRRPDGLTARAAASAAAPAEADDPDAEAVLQELATRIAAPSVTEVDPASLVPGTRLVQFGAFDDEDAARDRWDALATRFPDQMAGRDRVIEQATAGGSTFYRLRAHGFSDEPEARRFCAVFMHESIDCIPVLVR